MRSERARCWNASYPENSVTDSSRAVCRKWLCPGIERSGGHRDAVHEALCRLVGIRRGWSERAHFALAPAGQQQGGTAG
jgi:hypothetical protein